MVAAHASAVPAMLRHTARRLASFSARDAYDAPGAAAAYRDYANIAPWRVYGERFTQKKLLGDLSGKRVLDLACGDGTNARWLHDDCGAKEVVGVDFSEAMIEQARAHTPSSSSIRYEVGDAAEVGESVLRGARFDVVLANYLLNYAQDEPTLAAYLRAARRVLGFGGLFVAANDFSEPVERGGGVEPHGVVEIVRHGCRKTIAPEAVGVEGAPVLVELFVPEPPHEGWPEAGAAGRRLKPRTSAAEPCAPQGRASRLRAPRLAEGAPPGTPLLSFHNFYLSQPTHTACFLKAGFADPERHRLEISPEGLDRAPAGFWDGMLANGPVYYRAESVVPYGFQPAFWPRVPRYDRHGELVPGTSPREKREN